MWYHGLLPLLVFIGLHQSSGFRLKQLHATYENDDDAFKYMPHGFYADEKQDEVPHIQMNEDVIPVTGNDGRAVRTFIVLSHDKTPNSEKHKVSGLSGLLGIGPELVYKKEKEEKEYNPWRPYDPTSNSEKSKVGIELFGRPIGPQLSHTKKTERGADNSVSKSHQINLGLELFGVPLGQFSLVNKKKVNEVDALGDNDSESNAQTVSAGFGILGYPVGPQISYTKGKVEQEYESPRDDVLKPKLVPVGTVLTDGYGGSYHHETTQLPSKQLQQHIFFTKQQAIQTHPKKQDLRRSFVFSGDEDVEEKVSAGIKFVGIPVGPTLNYDRERDNAVGEFANGALALLKSLLLNGKDNLSKIVNRIGKSSDYSPTMETALQGSIGQQIQVEQDSLSRLRSLYRHYFVAKIITHLRSQN